MEMTTDLYRAVAGVGGAQHDSGSADIEFNITFGCNDLARHHTVYLVLPSANRFMNCHQLGTVGESGFYLQHRHQGWDTRHDIVRIEYRGPERD